MHEIQIVLVSLLVSVVVLGTVARLVHVPYPIVLVIGGLALGSFSGPMTPSRWTRTSCW